MGHSGTPNEKVINMEGSEGFADNQDRKDAGDTGEDELQSDENHELDPDGDGVEDELEDEDDTDLGLDDEDSDDDDEEFDEEEDDDEDE